MKVHSQTALSAGFHFFYLWKKCRFIYLNTNLFIKNMKKLAYNKNLLMNKKTFLWSSKMDSFWERSILGIERDGIYECKLWFENFTFDWSLKRGRKKSEFFCNHFYIIQNQERQVSLRIKKILTYCKIFCESILNRIESACFERFGLFLSMFLKYSLWWKTFFGHVMLIWIEVYPNFFSENFFWLEIRLKTRALYIN